MDTDSRSGEGEGQEDLRFSTEIEIDLESADPLAQLAIDLAISILYIEESKGGFCDDCTCIGWHCTTESEECELCFCLYQHTNPLPLLVSSAPLARGRYRDSVYNLDKDMVRGKYSKDRDNDARNALKELTE